MTPAEPEVTVATTRGDRSAVSSPEEQTRKAWLVLAICFTMFALVTVVVIYAGFWTYRHATAPETATLEVVSGGGALVRSPGDSDWRLIDAGTRVRERDQISTALGTVVWVTTFDGSTIEVAEDTIVTIERMRSSRFLNRTKLIDVELDRGTVYLGMASRGDYTYSELVVRTGNIRVVMSDERGRDGAGSYLVERLPDLDGQQSPTARVAVLRGEVRVSTSVEDTRLAAAQQVFIDSSGRISSATSAVRELVVNGTFEYGLDGWVDFVHRGPLAPEGLPPGASVELVYDQTPRGGTVAIELLRPSDAINTAVAGIRQRIGKTIRIHSSLMLDIEIRITDQQPPSSGADLTQFPLIIEINYIDTDGQENRWSHGYYILSDPGVRIPRDRATRLERDMWQRIVFDLRNLSPLPRQVTSIVLYASGESYQTRIANISLTSAELVETE